MRAFSVIHSLDSWSLAERASRIASEEERSPEVYLQVKLRPDPSKGGWSAADLLEAWPRLAALPGQLSNPRTPRAPRTSRRLVVLDILVV